MIQRFIAGEPLTESRMNGLVDGVNRLGGDANGTYSPFAGDGGIYSRLRGGFRPASVMMAIARPRLDVIPQTQKESAWGDREENLAYGESPFDPNGVIQAWDDGLEAWVDDYNRYIEIGTIDNLPLIEGEPILVIYSPERGVWVPAETPRSAMIEITNGVPNADGLLEGKIKKFDSDNLTWYDANKVWVIDANKS